MLRPREEGGSGRHFGRRNVTFSVLGGIRGTPLQLVSKLARVTANE